MVSIVNICNFALQNIGANTITTLTEDTNEAIQCNLRYESIRAMVLEAHSWNFASKRVALNKESVGPVFGFDNQFALPSDFVRIIATEEQIDFINFGSNFNGFLTISNRSSFAEADNYKIEISSTTGAKVLLSDDDDKNILYVFDQQDTAKFPPLFVEMLAKGLGATIAYRITNNKSLVSEELKEFEAMMNTTKLSDAQQGKYQRVEQSILLGVRQ